MCRALGTYLYKCPLEPRGLRAHLDSQASRIGHYVSGEGVEERSVPELHRGEGPLQEENRVQPQE